LTPQKLLSKLALLNLVLACGEYLQKRFIAAGLKRGDFLPFSAGNKHSPQ
jgi:hypothetical protein